MLESAAIAYQWLWVHSVNASPNLNALSGAGKPTAGCTCWCLLQAHYHNPPASLLAWENNVSPKEHFFNSLKVGQSGTACTYVVQAREQPPWG